MHVLQLKQSALALKGRAPGRISGGDGADEDGARPLSGCEQRLSKPFSPGSIRLVQRRIAHKGRRGVGDVSHRAGSGGPLSRVSRAGPSLPGGGPEPFIQDSSTYRP